MKLEPEDFEIRATSGYEVVGKPTIDNGELTINPFEITVVIKGNEKTVLKNDTEQSVDGFTAEAQGNYPSTFDISKVLWKGGINPAAKGTEVGSYPMELDEKDFTYEDKNFRITYQVTDGRLNITAVNTETVDPPAEPDDKGEVLPEYRDDRVKKTGVSTADNSSSKGNSGVKTADSGSSAVNTADSSKLILYVKILCIAVAILLIVLITRIESKKDNE